MKLCEFDYELPEELIAQEPALEREHSRLMVLKKNIPRVEHRIFKNVLDYLSPGDTMVLNNSKVIPARLTGIRRGTGARVEVLLLRPINLDCWEVLVKPGKKARIGDKFDFNEKLISVVKDRTSTGGRIMQFEYTGSFLEIIEEAGEMPLPPYIKKQPADPGRYQTVYADTPGSVAAPTAGLHFTSDLLEEARKRGVNVVNIMLHVGLGTFRPVHAENIEEHHMHSEFYEINASTAKAIENTRHAGGRVIAVGTTTTRCLESVAAQCGEVVPYSGWTDIFIYPGFEFKVVSGLVTNFHLPRSTLLMMVSAFAGKENILNAYRSAVKERYRFFSFGDAMLII
ncbi:MAG: tRNA preQ1(34) S-adenosylmethionine ribosyltransferase-isomerase QueA [Clostridiales bacterium]|nr:tRNA preQ1(34) S-adenosylmethionine ribosyltransferase-isomerase QueA [Clostridiales bacterium]MCF8022115.1 tRNA preQ1(34) S-adenosylmethionine ribosyltransferase-isomerase QueA [Clostridiales bacterium]